MLSTDSGFSENVYLAAALERLREAEQLLDGTPAYALAAYTAGVAVECVLHAYWMRSGVTEDAKHDVALLAQRSGFFNGMTSSERERVGSFLNEVFTRWRNNHRYRDEKALRDFVVRYRLYIVQGQRNALQHNAEMLLEAATQIVNSGVARWNHS